LVKHHGIRIEPIQPRVWSCHHGRRGNCLRDWCWLLCTSHT
jgi:hypothetical protein